MKVLSYTIVEVSKEVAEFISQVGSATAELVNELQARKYSYLVGTCINPELLEHPLIYVGTLTSPSTFLAVKSYYNYRKEGDESFLCINSFDIEPQVISLKSSDSKLFSRNFCSFTDFGHMVDYCKNDWETRIALHQ